MEKKKNNAGIVEELDAFEKERMMGESNRGRKENIEKVRNIQ